MEKRDNGISADNAEQEPAQDAQLRNAAFFLLLVFLSVTIVLLTTTFPNHRRNCELVRLSAQLKREKSQLRKRNDHLRRQIEALKCDPLYIEAAARQKYKLLKTGEMIIQPSQTPESQ